jgi:diguanylate cyclase (GGDEF)-like protein
MLAQDLKSLRESNIPVAVMLCDVDHFKHVNDVHGHLIGDAVLREVSRRMKEAIQPWNAVGRYGGEEFLIVLGGCQPEHLSEVAERVRMAICGRPFRLENGPLPITLSIGAMAVRNGEVVSQEDVLNRVDKALYRAKEEGRNRVVMEMELTRI